VRDERVRRGYHRARTSQTRAMADSESAERSASHDVERLEVACAFSRTAVVVGVECLSNDWENPALEVVQELVLLEVYSKSVAVDQLCGGTRPINQWCMRDRQIELGFRSSVNVERGALQSVVRQLEEVAGDGAPWREWPCERLDCISGMRDAAAPRCSVAAVITASDHRLPFWVVPPVFEGQENTKNEPSSRGISAQPIEWWQLDARRAQAVLAAIPRSYPVSS